MSCGDRIILHMFHILLVVTERKETGFDIRSLNSWQLFRNIGLSYLEEKTTPDIQLQGERRGGLQKTKVPCETLINERQDGEFQHPPFVFAEDGGPQHNLGLMVIS